MPSPFRPGANAIARGVVLLVPLTAVGLFFALLGFGTSPYFNKVGIEIEQPVPFSHQHHVGGLGIDCRYCHTSVEVSSSAGLPPTETCMNCHQQIWTDSPMLAPVRESWQTNKPIQWKRVHNVPDFVYFNHSVHIAGGIGCSTCHGRVDEMPLTFKSHTLYMQWCLGCHRAPERYIRPKSEIYSMTWEPPADQRAQGKKLAQEYHVNTAGLTNCSACHR